MTYKFLLTIFLTGLGSLAVFTPKAIAQERPECYIIDDSGELTDLTDICNASQRQSTETDATTNEGENVVNNNIKIIDSKHQDTGVSADDGVFVLGKKDASLESDLIDSTYYIDNEIGVDYTAYTRRYQTPSTSIDRQTLRTQVFQFDTKPSLTSILRHGRELPFIIYRYPI